MTFAPANFDAFSRLRVSNPEQVFDTQFTYDLQPFQFEQVTSGAEATIAHDATNRCASITFDGATSGDYAFMQSYDFCRYQPGRSQLAFITFDMDGPTEGVTKFAGLWDGDDGWRGGTPARRHGARSAWPSAGG